MRIAERLRSHPVLAVGTVEIASEHAKTVSERSGVRVKEGLLLDRIALHAADITPWHEKATALVEPDLANANRAVGQRTAVAAGVAAKSTVGQTLVQRAFARFAREHLSQCEGHVDQLYAPQSSWDYNPLWHVR